MTDKQQKVFDSEWSERQHHDDWGAECVYRADGANIVNAVLAVKPEPKFEWHWDDLS